MRGFLWLRSILTPYARMASALPARGRVLDLGSGHGLLAFALSRDSPRREIIGIDHGGPPFLADILLVAQRRL